MGDTKKLICKTEGGNERAGIFVHCLKRSGSMFLYRLLKDICQRKGIVFFSENNEPSNENELREDISKDFCIGPIRGFRLSDKKFYNIKRIYYIIQVRDPRDVIVSEYFSSGFSHPVPPEEPEKEAFLKRREFIHSVSLDGYALHRAPELKKEYDTLIAIKKKDNANVIIVRYEEMVIDFRGWLSRIIKPFQFHDESRIVNELYSEYAYEFKPRKENIMVHKRKIIPGDHLEKLETETIKKLDYIFKNALAYMNYPSRSEQVIGLKK